MIYIKYNSKKEGSGYGWKKPTEKEIEDVERFLKDMKKSLRKGFKDWEKRQKLKKP